MGKALDVVSDVIRVPFSVDALAELQSKLAAIAIAIVVPISVVEGTHGAPQPQAEKPAFIVSDQLRLCR